MRGTAFATLQSNYFTRFIPADAGNGFPVSPVALPPAVYPRGCGERAFAWLPNSCASGLSPRMRGTVQLVCNVLTAARFIPADAGNGLAICFKSSTVYGLSPR